MHQQEAKPFVTSLFNHIIKAKTVEELVTIESNTFEKKYMMDTASYPKIDFAITPREIELLQQQKLLGVDYSLSTDVINSMSDPLTKLLYSLAWKNGDLKKLKHIAKGIAEVNKPDCEPTEALVFHQFGCYLTKTEGQPIIDQHVIRSFAVYKLNNPEQIHHYLALSTLSVKHKEMINNYKGWLQSEELTTELKQQADYTYYIDRILFAAGKMIKMSRKSKVT